MSFASRASDAGTQFLSFMMDVHAESHGMLGWNNASSAYNCMSSDGA